MRRHLILHTYGFQRNRALEHLLDFNLAERSPVLYRLYSKTIVGRVYELIVTSGLQPMLAARIKMS
jgi:hypothetical protein